MGAGAPIHLQQGWLDHPVPAGEPQEAHQAAQVPPSTHPRGAQDPLQDDPTCLLCGVTQRGQGR